MGLYRACTRGRPAEVRRLIRDGHNVNAYGSGRTPLLIATYHGHVEIARELIRANADVHLKVRESGKSALHIAAYYIYQVWLKFVSLLMMLILRMDEQVAREMVRAKADNYWTIKGSGRTALHIAAYYGHQAMVKLFVETNININEQDDEGRTALMLAVERGHSAVVAELVKAGADISLKDKKGMTAVLLAKSYDMVHQLVRDVDHLSREDRSRILWHACDVGELSTVQSVIEAGCDVDHIHKGQTPVMMATLRGHNSIVKELILANCDVNLHSNVYYSRLVGSLSMVWPGEGDLIWFLAMGCLLVQWLSFTVDVWIDPVMGILAVLVMVGVAGMTMQVVPGNVKLRTRVVVTAMILIMVVAVMAGPVVLKVLVVLAEVVLVMLLFSRTAEFVSYWCALIALQFVVSVILVWSPREVEMVITVAMAGAVIVIVVMVLRKTTVSLRDLVVGLLGVGGFGNIELLVVAAASMRIGRSTVIFHESVAAQMLMEVLIMMVFMVIPVVVLTTQETVVAFFRGTLLFFAFEITTYSKMEIVLLPLGKLNPVLVMAVLGIVTVMLAYTAVMKEGVLMKGVMVVQYLVTAMVEIQEAVLISEPEEGAELWTVYLGNIVNITLILAMIASVEGTALHYAAGHDHIKCGVYLMEAGAEARTRNRLLYISPLEVGPKLFVDEMQKVLTFTTKRVIAVIGNTKHGKSTLVAALECTSNILWKKAVNRFKKVRDIRQRTAGIEAVQVSNQKYGEALFYDFAGQSQYHGPHQSFLEAMMSKRNVSATLLLLVKATEEEDVITQQLYRWLQPLALMSAPSTPKVMVVGSFLDQVKSRKEASEKLLRCTQSVKTQLHLNIEGPCLLDCRQPESRGIDQICSFLQEAHPVNAGALSYNLHWVLVQMRKAFSIPALRLHEVQTWLQDNTINLPRNLPSSEEVCQDLSAAGHTLFLPNKRDPSQRWLILDLPTLLHNVYGTLFSGSQGKDNQFGLLHCSQLAELFPELNGKMIQEVLKSLEFCIEVDPLLLKEELSKLTVGEGEEGWLYFPALVSAQPHEFFPEDPSPDPFQWMCWQLRTAENHIIFAHLLQTIILRLAAKHVFTHKLFSSVRKHCCRVWVNGTSWSSTKGVDIAVQISSVVQVVGRSKAGPQRLQEYTAAIVRDVTKTIAHLSPKLEATPYIIHPYTPTLWEDPKAPQPSSLYPVASILCCISDGDDHVPSLSSNTSSIPIDQLFRGELPSLGTVQALNYRSVAQNDSSEAPLNPLLSTPTLNKFNQLVVWRVAAKWNSLGLSLGVEPEVLNIVKENHPGDVEGCCRDLLHRWLSRGPGTGEQPRVWLPVLEAVKETVGETVAEEIERVIVPCREADQQSL